MKSNSIVPALETTIDVLYHQASSVIERARDTAYRQINEALVKRNWQLGKLIADEELNGQDRAAYGAKIIVKLSKRLKDTFGKGFSRRDLYNYLSFYKLYGNLFTSNDGIVYSVSTQSNMLLSWTHYRTLIQELNTEARRWYEQEAAEQNWSVRTLQCYLTDSKCHVLYPYLTIL